ncbi:MAG: RdgB/HAM1 family non-canonical purine NTP pyrophosphatase [Candidatus Paceibacterota bacterium]
MIFITGNQNKVREFEEILGQKLESVDLDLEEIQSIDVENVASEKAKKAFEILKKPLIVEDTGLHFEEMNGLPGALIRFFVDKLSLEQICGLVKHDRRASAKTCIAYADKNGIKLFTGEVEGEIVKEPRGKNGFGWDPIFVPENEKKTFAEMTAEEKSSRFMRFEAAGKLKSFLTAKQ